MSGTAPPRVATQSRSRHATMGGLATENSPEWARKNEALSQIDAVGDRYVLTAEAPMEYSGSPVIVRDDKLEIAHGLVRSVGHARR
jgi:hypothetical protein